jgi:3-oxoacyl-[acyl-carrier protein] reductase
MTVVVTGGATGIGRAVVTRLIAQGRDVTAVGRRPDVLAELAAQTGSDVVAADVSTVAGARAVRAHLDDAGTSCEAVVAAAGGLPGASDAADPLDGIRLSWQEAFASNVLSAVLVVEALRDQLANGGRVVLLSSVAGLRGSGGGPYGAVKAALHGWCFDLAAELGPGGGTANVVAPGFVPDTGFWAGRLSPESRSRRAEQTLVGREGTPDEVASLIAWLLGPDGGWVTGQILSPNGGVVLGR